MWSAPTAPDGDSPAFPLVSTYVEPPAGIEPETPSLPWIGGQAPCYPAYLQVTRYRKGRSYGASWRA